MHTLFARASRRLPEEPRRSAWGLYAVALLASTTWLNHELAAGSRVADDFTGATDLANNLVRAGMRVVQTIGVPADPLPADCNAVVVALKYSHAVAQLRL
jgi:hypothetical protein